MEEVSRDKGSGPMDVCCQLPLMFHQRGSSRVEDLEPNPITFFRIEALPKIASITFWKLTLGYTIKKHHGNHVFPRKLHK